MNMPEARESAESESLDMLVDLGRVCLSRRRMHAAGGSKSCVVVVLFVAAAADLLLAGGAAALEDSTTAVDSLLLSVTVSAVAAEEEAAIDCCSVVEEGAAAAVVVSMVVFITPIYLCWLLGGGFLVFLEVVDVGTIEKVPALSVLFGCISCISKVLGTYIRFEFFAVFLPSFWGDWGESRNQA